MNIEKLDINRYFYEYLLQNKVIFFACTILLLIYPLQKVVLPKYYGKVLSDLHTGSENKFMKSAKALLMIYAAVQLIHAIFQKVQGHLVPKFSEFSMNRIFSSLLKNDNEDFENMKVGEILAKVSKVPTMIYRYLDLLKSVIFSQLIVFATCAFHYYQVSFQTLLAFLLCGFGVMLLQFITYKVTMGVEMKREREQDEIYQHLQDVLENLISIIVCKGFKNKELSSNFFVKNYWK